MKIERGSLVSSRSVCPLVLAATVLVAVLPSSASSAPPRGPAEVIQAIYDRILEKLDARADADWHTGEFARYVRLARLMAELCPTCEETYTNGAWLMESLERHDEAVAFYRLGISRNPKSAYLHYDLAHFLFRHDRFAEALPYAQEATRAGDIWVSWHLLAHTYEALGRLDEAIETWEADLKKWPNDEPAKQNLRRLRTR